MFEWVGPTTGSVEKGIGMTAALNLGIPLLGIIAVLGFLPGPAAIALIIFAGIGVVQLAWMVPLVLAYRRRGETETAKGLTIGAGITFLLNAGCWGLLAGMRG